MPCSKTTPKAKSLADYVTDLFCRIVRFLFVADTDLTQFKVQQISFLFLRFTTYDSQSFSIFLFFYLLFFSPYIFFFLRLVDNSYTTYLLVYQGSTTRACLSRVTYRDFPLPSTHFVNNSRIRYTRTRSLIIGTWPTILRTILLAR